MGTLEAATTALSYVHTGLDLSTTYYYRLSARNSIGLSEPSSTATATTWESLSAPDAPKNLTGIAAGTTINLSWEAPESDGGVTISGYRVESSTDGETWTELASSVTSTRARRHRADPGDDLPLPGQRAQFRGAGHAFRRHVSDGAGDGGGAGQAAERYRRKHRTAYDRELSWDLPSSDGGASVTGYKIEHSRRLLNESWIDVEADTGSRDTTYVDSGPRRRHQRTTIASRRSTPPATVGTASPRASAITDRPSVPSAPLNVQGDDGIYRRTARLPCGGTPRQTMAAAGDSRATISRCRSAPERNGTGSSAPGQVLSGELLFDPVRRAWDDADLPRQGEKQPVGTGPPSDEVTITGARNRSRPSPGPDRDP